jgi:hypothetical protein
MSVTRTRTALLVVATLLPASIFAQRGGARPTGPIGPVIVRPPVAHPQVGFGALEGPRPTTPRVAPRPRSIRGFGIAPFGARALGGFLYGPTVVETQPAPAAPPPAPVTYYYYPVPVAPSEPPPPEPPYDPAKSRTLLISEGVDGGAGVMTIEHLAGDSLRLTWRGSVEPIRSAQLFLADSMQQPLRARAIDVQSRSATFWLGDITPAVAYSGLTVVSARGAMATTLVPYRKP